MKLNCLCFEFQIACTQADRLLQAFGDKVSLAEIRQAVPRSTLRAENISYNDFEEILSRQDNPSPTARIGKGSSKAHQPFGPRLEVRKSSEIEGSELPFTSFFLSYSLQLETINICLDGDRNHFHSVCYFIDIPSRTDPKNFVCFGLLVYALISYALGLTVPGVQPVKHDLHIQNSVWSKLIKTPLHIGFDN